MKLEQDNTKFECFRETKDFKDHQLKFMAVIFQTALIAMTRLNNKLSEEIVVMKSREIKLQEELTECKKVANMSDTQVNKLNNEINGLYQIIGTTGQLLCDRNNQIETMKQTLVEQTACNSRLKQELVKHVDNYNQELSTKITELKTKNKELEKQNVSKNEEIMKSQTKFQHLCDVFVKIIEERDYKITSLKNMKDAIIKKDIINYTNMSYYDHLIKKSYY